jgi:hypothetical protein
LEQQNLTIGRAKSNRRPPDIAWYSRRQYKKGQNARFRQTEVEQLRPAPGDQ